MPMIWQLAYRASENFGRETNLLTVFSKLKQIFDGAGRGGGLTGLRSYVAKESLAGERELRDLFGSGPQEMRVLQLSRDNRLCSLPL